MKLVKNLLEAQTKAFINSIETAHSIQNSIISGEIIKDATETYANSPLNPWKVYSTVTSNKYEPIINENVSTAVEKQVDFIKNITNYNLSLYKKWYGIN